jgi:hypothetical protein
LQKCFVFLIIAYVFSSIKLKKKAEQILPGNKWGEGRGDGEKRERAGEQGGRNDSNNMHI